MVFENLAIWQAFGFSLVAGAVAGSIMYAACVLLLWCVDRRRRWHAGVLPADPRKVKMWLPDHAHRRRQDEDSPECSICLGELEEGERCCTLAACRHEFHKECIYRWVDNHNTCPLCRHKAVDAPTPSSAGGGAGPPPARESNLAYTDKHVVPGLYNTYTGTQLRAYTQLVIVICQIIFRLPKTTMFLIIEN
uniref:RING-type domain-containing protein n=1 Tax=Oryza brachyantha TaxID=4533 RepID=J3NAS5_ORYBR